MILAAATTLLFVIILGPRFIKKLYELKIGQSIRGMDECPLLAELHGKKKDTPTMGGILILSSISAALLLWMDLTNVFTWLLLFIMLALGFLGGIDDYLKLRFKNSKGIRPRKKLLVQVALSSLLAIYLLTPVVQDWIPLKAPSAKEQVLKSNNGKRPLVITKTLSLQEYICQVYLPFFKGPVLYLSWFLSFLFIVFVITGSSNAVNLTDGLDGLAAGCLVMVSMVLGLFAFFSNHIDLARYLNILYIEGSGEIAVFLFAMAGACLGFLWYNGYPAQVFMGDTGSLALGGVLGFAAVILRREVILAIAGAIFVAEALSVILQVLSYRYRNKKRIFLCAPLHHHFEYLGWPEMKVVIRFWIVSLFFAMIAVASLKFQ
jgi:phospho-N-acetylmuramoyl-pentapeptide-transferase